MTGLRETPIQKTYIGTKIIKAVPMTLGDYNTYRGWKIPDNEDPMTEGYLVEYPDGYESWSPRDVFETAYREITPQETTFIV